MLRLAAQVELAVKSKELGLSLGKSWSSVPSQVKGTPLSALSVWKALIPGQDGARPVRPSVPASGPAVAGPQCNGPDLYPCTQQETEPGPSSAMPTHALC